MKSPCYFVTLSLESSDFQTFLKQYVILVSSGALTNSTIQLVVVNLYTKFEVSILSGCKDIFDENSGVKEKKTNIGKNK